MTRIEKFLRSLPAAALFILGLVLVALVWSIDRRIPNQVSMSIFYLIPIGLVAWFAGGRWAYAISLVAAGAWLQNDLAVSRSSSHWLAPFWNAFVRLGFFVIVTYLSTLVVRMRRLHDLEQTARKASQEASELKSRMLSFVSHEFGNSLTTFKMALEFLIETEPNVATYQRKHCYETLERVFTHLNSATSNFLNLNRLESGRFKPEFRRTPLRSIIHGAIAVLEPLTESKKVTLRLELPEHPVPVRADPDALSLVMTNLIGNAFKYTPAQGVVTVRILPIIGQPGVVEVSVQDTGIGISKEEQGRLFSEYYRTEGGKAIANGYGVGLKVARELLESQGAQLELQSEPGKGSRFFFRLPLFQEDAEKAIPAAR